MEGIKQMKLVCKRFCFLGVCVLLSLQVIGQVNEMRVFKTNFIVNDFDNTTFCTAYLSNGSMYTLRSYPIAKVNNVQQIIFNPTGSSLAVMREKKPVSIYSFRQADKRMFELKEERKKLKAKPLPVAMCYSDDARSFVLSNTLNEIVIYDTREYLPQAYIQSETLVTAVTVSSNNYYLAAAAGKKIDIWNFRNQELRTSVPMPANVTEVSFSADASMLAVTTDDNRLTIIETRNWEKIDIFDKLGGALSSPVFHPDGKYIAVVKDGNAIVLVNLKSSQIEQLLEQSEGGIKHLRIFKNNNTSDVLMVSNRPKSVVYWDANGLNPFYGKLLNREVDAKMNEWVKMMQGESMEDYAIRVNDETRLQQQQFFTQEVATAMAGDRISIDNPFVEAYDAAGNLLNIGFNSLGSISLKVDADEAGDFGDAGKLKFSNAVYVLNENDEFEIAYVEVLNETTNKVYIYDNIGRTKLTALEEDLNFVPLEIMQQATREEVQLRETADLIVEESKQEALITDNTQINVKTEVIPGTDVNGNKILNYQVGYQYEVVNKAFSATEDFPSGGYNIERSNAAMSLMKIIKNAFEGDFAKYLGEGKQVKIVITGSADASPIRGKIAYDGRYGEFIDEPYYKDGNLDEITVTKAGGITENEQLALLRAAGVKNYISNNVNTLTDTQNEYQFNIEVAKERGGEFRRINVEFLIMDAFPR